MHSHWYWHMEWYCITRVGPRLQTKGKFDRAAFATPCEGNQFRMPGLLLMRQVETASSGPAFCVPPLPLGSEPQIHPVPSRWCHGRPLIPEAAASDSPGIHFPSAWTAPASASGSVAPAALRSLPYGYARGSERASLPSQFRASAAQRRLRQKADHLAAS